MSLSRLGPVVHAIAALIPLAWVHAVVNQGQFSLPSPGLISLCVFLGLLPDIDSHTSFMGRKFPEISLTIERRFGHRTLTHSLFAISIIGFIAWLLTPEWQVLAWAYTSHIIVDMIVGGRSGITLLFPWHHRFNLFHVDSESRGELTVGAIAFSLVLLPLFIPSAAVQVNAAIPRQPTPTATKTPRPTPTPVPTLISIRVEHVYDIEAEIMVKVGDTITVGQQLANLQNLRATLAAPTATATWVLLPTLAPTPTQTPVPTAYVNQQVLARAWSDLQYAQAVATKAFRPPSVDEMDRICGLVADGQSRLENMRNTLWAKQLSRDNKVVENELGWLEQKALEAPLLEMERQIAEEEQHIVELQADCDEIAIKPYAADEFDRQIAAAALQRAYAIYAERVATPTRLPTRTPTFTPTFTPLPTITPTPDVGDTFIYAPTGGDVHRIDVGTFSDAGADVTIHIATGYGQPLPARALSPATATDNGSIEVYFTQTDVNIEQQLIDRIQAAQSTIDIASFEFNLDPVADALIAAHERGVQVRWVTDDEYGLHEDDESGHGQFARMQAAGIEVRDDDRSALMHNKFWIFDGAITWTGSTNITHNGTQRNNNNVIVFDSPEIAAIYQREFDEMWAGAFGANSPSTVAEQHVDLNGVPVEVLFGPEDGVAARLTGLILSAQESIRFMAFSFTRDDMGIAMQQVAAETGDVQGIFESRGSGTEYSELQRLHCESIADVRTDGNGATFHHKAIIIDEYITITGSFNFSNNANERNDENLVVVWDEAVAAAYLSEFGQRWDEANLPSIECP